VARVFISYANEDLTQAREVHRWLSGVGHEVFLDQDSRDGIAVGLLAVSSGFGDQVRVVPAWRVDEGVIVSLAA
jgi:hypothetical protein